MSEQSATDTSAEPGEDELAEPPAKDAEELAPAPPAAPDLGTPGPPLERHSPFYIGFVGGLGALTAYFLVTQLSRVTGALILTVVALFLAAGLNPAVLWFERHGLRRRYALVSVIGIVLVALVGFVFTLMPVIGDQIQLISENAPEWLEELQNNAFLQRLDERFGVIDRFTDWLQQGDWISTIFGGVLGFGLMLASAVANALVLVVLTLYFLAGLDATKSALYRLAPASRRDRVSKLSDRVLEGIGGYVSGAFIVAMCAGITSVIFLFAVGLGEYAVALAFVVALLDFIPMIGATLGASVVTLIGFANDPKIGVMCILFYLAYQGLENWVIYPRVMSRAVDVPGAITVIAALIGAGLLGVAGALMAIPTAAALLMITREVFIRRQDER